MKCPNCGANISSRAVYCPYCDALNPKAKLREQQRERAQFELRTAEEETAPVLRRLTANKVLNRILIAEAILVALYFVGTLLVFMFGDALVGLRWSFSRGGLDAEFASLYEQQRFGELYLRLDETDSFGEDYYEYSQMALIHYDYQNFTQERMAYRTENAEGEIDEYTADFLARAMHDILQPYIPAYPELTDRNAEVLAEYQAEVLAFARHTLGLTDAEIELMRQDYMYTEDEDAVAAAIRERRLEND